MRPNNVNRQGLPEYGFLKEQNWMLEVVIPPEKNLGKCPWRIV
jgi:hypothetical protein